MNGCSNEAHAIDDIPCSDIQGTVKAIRLLADSFEDAAKSMNKIAGVIDIVVPKRFFIKRKQAFQMVSRLKKCSHNG